MSSNIVPAGFENYRGDYFESDDEDLEDVIYPNLKKPSIKVSSVSDGSESGNQSKFVTDTTKSEEKRSRSSTDDESVEKNNQYKKENSVSPEETTEEVSGSEKKDEKKEKGDPNYFIDWFNDDKQSSPISLSPDISHARESRSPSPGVLLLEDIRMATINGDLQYIKIQMSTDHGFFIDTVLKNSWTILMYACDFGYAHIVQYCLENNADPNYHHDKFTPLMAACQSFYADEDKVVLIAEMLLKFGAMIDAVDLLGKNALMYASETGKAEVVLFLAQNGANVKAKDSKNWTCLHFAAKRGFGPAVRFLIDYGAKLNVYNSFGQSPADIAMDHGFHELGTLLERLRLKEPVSIEENGILMKREARKNSFVTHQANYLTEMQYFLGELGLLEYVSFFEQQKISYNDLLSFNETDLDALKIDKYGIKLKLWEGIKAAHRRNWHPSKFSLLKRKSQLSLLEADVLIRKIGNYLKYMDTTLKYIRNHLKSDPDLLKRGSDCTNAEEFFLQIKNTLAEGKLTMSTLDSIVQDLSDLTVTSNGCEKMEKVQPVPTTKPNVQMVQPLPYKNAAFIFSGLLGLGAIVYFQRDSISSLVTKK